MTQLSAVPNSTGRGSPGAASLRSASSGVVIVARRPPFLLGAPEGHAFGVGFSISRGAGMRFAGNFSSLAVSMRASRDQRPGLCRTTLAWWLRAFSLRLAQPHPRAGGAVLVDKYYARGF